jgi:hypothetical protein
MCSAETLTHLSKKHSVMAVLCLSPHVTSSDISRTVSTIMSELPVVTSGFFSSTLTGEISKHTTANFSTRNKYCNQSSSFQNHKNKDCHDANHFASMSETQDKSERTNDSVFLESAIPFGEQGFRHNIVAMMQQGK